MESCEPSCALETADGKLPLKLGWLRVCGGQWTAGSGGEPTLAKDVVLRNPGRIRPLAVEVLEHPAWLRCGFGGGERRALIGPGEEGTLSIEFADGRIGARVTEAAPATPRPVAAPRRRDGGSGGQGSLL